MHDINAIVAGHQHAYYENQELRHSSQPMRWYNPTGEAGGGQYLPIDRYTTTVQGGTPVGSVNRRYEGGFIGSGGHQYNYSNHDATGKQICPNGKPMVDGSCPNG